MNKTLPTLLLLSLLLARPTAAQQVFRVMSYNVENLFDTADDPAHDDNEFLPSGNRRWTPARYYHKLQQLAKVMTAAGEWDTPALIGLCEVENDSVITHLLGRTPLRQQHYRYFRTHGHDVRGINTALLYQRDKFAVHGQAEYPIRFTRNKQKQTRNILHVWGNVATGDILDVFVCHFPSRYGGEKESEAARFDAAQTLRHLCDSLQQVRPLPRIIIMGDFNDTPQNESISRILAAHPLTDRCLPADRPVPAASSSNPPRLPVLYNLFAHSETLNPPGSHKYQGEWSQLDQIIISSSLADTTASMFLKPGSPHIFAPSFLLSPDKTGRGKRPKRSFYGFKYEAGYSDHLPVIADFLLPLPTNQ